MTATPAIALAPPLQLAVLPTGLSAAVAGPCALHWGKLHMPDTQAPFGCSAQSVGTQTVACLSGKQGPSNLSGSPSTQSPVSGHLAARDLAGITRQNHTSSTADDGSRHLNDSSGAGSSIYVLASCTLRQDRHAGHPASKIRYVLWLRPLLHEHSKHANETFSYYTNTDVQEPRQKLFYE